MSQTRGTREVVATVWIEGMGEADQGVRELIAASVKIALIKATFPFLRR